MFELNDDTRFILGRPNFACASIARILRKGGQEIEESSEDEQAAVIYFMLTMYEEHGSEWKKKGDEVLLEMIQK